MIEIYTDGACSGNPGPGGYGIILKKGDYEKHLSQGFKYTTNNRMELLAVIVGLESLKNDDLEVVIYSDSKYVVDAVMKGWLFNWKKNNFKNKKNKDLWLRFLTVYAKHRVKFKWIKGHNEHPYNEACDRLAVKATKDYPLLEDKGFVL